MQCSPAILIIRIRTQEHRNHFVSEHKMSESDNLSQLVISSGTDLPSASSSSSSLLPPPAAVPHATHTSLIFFYILLFRLPCISCIISILLPSHRKYEGSTTHPWLTMHYSSRSGGSLQSRSKFPSEWVARSIWQSN